MGWSDPLRWFFEEEDRVLLHGHYRMDPEEGSLCFFSSGQEPRKVITALRGYGNFFVPKSWVKDVADLGHWRMQ